MRFYEVQAVKTANTSKFKILTPEFRELHDTLNEEEFDGEHYDAYIQLSAKYEGEPPQNYRVLNSFIMDYVDENKQALEKLLVDDIVKHFSSEESPIDPTSFKDEAQDYLWEEQVDYMPQVDEENKVIYFGVELVLALKPTEK